MNSKCPSDQLLENIFLGCNLETILNRRVSFPYKISLLLNGIKFSPKRVISLAIRSKISFNNKIPLRIGKTDRNLYEFVNFWLRKIILGFMAEYSYFWTNDCPEKDAN